MPCRKQVVQFQVRNQLNITSIVYYFLIKHAVLTFIQIFSSCRVAAWGIWVLQLVWAFLKLHSW